MLTLGEFFDSVSAAIGRGSVLDEVIEHQTRMAARWLERNADPGYIYMKKLGQFTLSPDGDFPYILDAPNDRVKCYLMLRITVDDEYKYLHLIDPREVSALAEGVPSGYWLDGTRRIVLDAIPEEEYDGEILWVEYSAWGSADNFTHWLLDNAEDALFNKTMINMAPWLRDTRLLELYKDNLSTALVTLQGALINMENENQNVVMNYV